MGSRTARQLNKTFPRITQLGLDIGLDRELHPWILEANPRPAIHGFKYLADKSIYRRIVQLSK
jgi:D-alanine-D-alanine ligase-like ATP-grasp enzyme